MLWNGCLSSYVQSHQSYVSIAWYSRRDVCCCVVVLLAKTFVSFAPQRIHNPHLLDIFPTMNRTYVLWQAYQKVNTGLLRAKLRFAEYQISEAKAFAYVSALMAERGIAFGASEVVVDTSLDEALAKPRFAEKQVKTARLECWEWHALLRKVVKDIHNLRNQHTTN